MYTKHIIVATALVLGMVTLQNSSAGEHYKNEGDYYDHARVVDVEPVYRIVQVSTPQRECHDERVVHRSGMQHDSATPTIMGGLLGGIVGSRFGKGTGKDVATVAGVFLGASLANDLRRSRRAEVPYVSRQQVCDDVYTYSEREELDGYDVRYRYHGNTYTTRMDHHPGKKIRVHVQVTPVGSR